MQGYERACLEWEYRLSEPPKSLEELEDEIKAQEDYEDWLSNIKVGEL
jgi:hypothetical protein